MRVKTRMKWTFDADEWSFQIQEAHDFVGSEFADIIGVSDDLVRSWEMMRSRHHFYRWPNMSELIRVCVVLDMDPRRFIITRYEP